MRIQTTGRTDITELFSKSQILNETKLRHTPFLVFLEEHGDVKVLTVDSAKRLVEMGLPGATPVMVQWLGKFRSDWFQMTAGDVAKAYGMLFAEPR